MCPVQASGDADTFINKHGHKADKRQPDQAGGVIALGALKQADPEAFCFEAASAVVGLLGMQVAFDLLRGERAHVHGKRYAVGLVLAGLAVEQCQAGQEADAGAAGLQQLLARIVKGVRLAKDLCVKDGYLVGADDQVLWVAASQSLRLLQGQAPDQFRCALVRGVGFVNIG